MRAKRTLINTILGFIGEGVNMICGLILPRLILTAFGSDYNGMTSAITQFFQVIVLFQAGIGGVTLAALYKPLAEKNREEISVIVKTTEMFLRKVCMIFAGSVIALSFMYPFVVKDSFDRWFTTGLVLVMGVSTFAQYFFGQTYQFLINADQRVGYIALVDTVKILLNTLIAVVLIKSGFGLIVVKAGSAVVYVLAPIFISIYAKRKYRIITTVKPDNSKLSQRWDKFGQQVANFICQNTNLIVLTIFSNVYEISVYAVYGLVIRGIQGFFNPLVRGVSAAFGNMFAKNEYGLINKNLRVLETVIFASSTFLFGCGAALILPFVRIYTHNITDVEYIRPLFAYLFIVSSLFQCYRFPYQGLVQVVGHFRQMRTPAFIEAGINIVLSIALVINIGIVGVIIGTLVAYIYRTVRYMIYMSRNVIKRSLLIAIKRITLSLVIVSIIAALPYVAPILSIYKYATSYLQWIVNALPIALIAIVLTLGAELLFYRNDLKNAVKIVHNVVNRKSGHTTIQ